MMGWQDTNNLLEKLKAPMLQGSYKRAYKMLVQLCNAVGWDGLLRVRGAVFVMEEEYKQVSKASASSLSASQECSAAPTGKHLCERWLDYLFSLLFEVCRCACRLISRT